MIVGDAYLGAAYSWVTSRIIIIRCFSDGYSIRAGLIGYNTFNYDLWIRAVKIDSDNLLTRSIKEN